MVDELTKSIPRRYHSGAYHSRYFVGHGIDIGGKPDPLSFYVGMFARMYSVRVWDVDDGDGQYLQSIEDNSYDFLCSSHCLEHIRDPFVALENWIRVVKPGGHIIVTVPDEDLYEQQIWPSAFNSSHQHTFTICKQQSWSPVSINVTDLAKALADKVQVEKIELVRDFIHPLLSEKKVDQTMGKRPAECSIEFIFKKYT